MVRSVQKLLSEFCRAVQVNNIGLIATVQCELAEKYLNGTDGKTDPKIEWDKTLEDLSTLPSPRAQVLLLSLLSQEVANSQLSNITPPFCSNENIRDSFKPGNIFKLEFEHADQLTQLRNKIVTLDRMIHKRALKLNSKTLMPLINQ